MEMNRIIRMRIARRDGLRADSPQEQQGGERGAEIKVSNYYIKDLVKPLRRIRAKRGKKVKTDLIRRIFSHLTIDNSMN